MEKLFVNQNGLGSQTVIINRRNSMFNPPKIKSVNTAGMKVSKASNFFNFVGTTVTGKPVIGEKIAMVSAFKTGANALTASVNTQLSSEKTKEMAEADEVRDDMLRGIDRLIAAHAVFPSVNREEIGKLLAVVKSYGGHKMRSANDGEETALIDGMQERLSTSPNAERVAMIDGLSDWLTKLNTANTNFKNLAEAKATEKATAGEASGKVRDDLIPLYMELKYKIEANAALNTAPEFEEVINLINGYIDTFGL